MVGGCADLRLGGLHGCHRVPCVNGLQGARRFARFCAAGVDSPCAHCCAALHVAAEDEMADGQAPTPDGRATQRALVLAVIRDMERRLMAARIAANEASK